MRRKIVKASRCKRIFLGSARKNEDKQKNCREASMYGSPFQCIF